MDARRRKVSIRAGTVVCAAALFLLCQPHRASTQALIFLKKSPVRARCRRTSFTAKAFATGAGLSLKSESVFKQVAS
jgi:hypothetical protein